MHDAAHEPVRPEDLRRWLAEDARPSPPPDEPPDRRRGPRWLRRPALLVAATAVPWLLAGVLLGTGALPPPAEPKDDAARSDVAAERAGDSAAAEPVAVRLVRDAVTSSGDRAATALDAAAAEPPDPLDDDTWIVRVHAVVLHGDDRRWHAATHEIWAAPVGRRDGAMVGLDAPWRVASGVDRIVDAAWTPAAVDVGEVRAALRRAGLPTTAELRAERHPRLAVLRAVVGGGSRRQRVWLRTTPTVEVLGHDRHAPTGP